HIPNPPTRPSRPAGATRRQPRLWCRRCRCGAHGGRGGRASMFRMAPMWHLLSAVELDDRNRLPFGAEPELAAARCADVPHPFGLAARGDEVALALVPHAG